MYQISFLEELHPLLLILVGVCFGMLMMWFLNRKDKTKIHKLITQLAVAEEKLTPLHRQEVELQQFKSQLMVAKTENAQLRVRMEEQAKNATEKLLLVQEAESKLKTQFENLANKIFAERSQQFNQPERNCQST